MQQDIRNLKQKCKCCDDRPTSWPSLVKLGPCTPDIGWHLAWSPYWTKRNNPPIEEVYQPIGRYAVQVNIRVLSN